MRKYRKPGRILLFAAGTAMLIQLTGCGAARQAQVSGQELEAGQSSRSGSEAENGSGQAAADPEGQAAESGQDTEGAGAGEIRPGTITAVLAGGVQKSITLEDEDLDADYRETAVQIQLEDTGIQVTGSGTLVSGSRVTIQKGGTYVVSGTLSDGQIYIDADQHQVNRVLVCVNINLSVGQGP